MELSETHGFLCRILDRRLEKWNVWRYRFPISTSLFTTCIVFFQKDGIRTIATVEGSINLRLLPFIYSDNESATILGKCQMNRVYARISCPTCLVFITAIWFSNVKKMRTIVLQTMQMEYIYLWEMWLWFNGFVCIDYHREKVIRKPSRTILLKNPCDTFVKPFILSFWLKDW